MAGRLNALLGGWRRRPPARRRWTELASNVGALTGAERRNLSEEARRLRGELDLFLVAARRQADFAARALPPGTDWSWRPLPFQSPLPSRGVAAPTSGAGLAPGVAVWHDLSDAALVVAQRPGRPSDSLPPFALYLESFVRRGQGYVALSFELPDDALVGLDTSFIIHVSTVMEAETPPTAYLRLNIEHGPDTERVLRSVQPSGRLSGEETGFDLGFVPIVPPRLVKIWLDVIIEQPGANALWLHDLVISRHRRADV